MGRLTCVYKQNVVLISGYVVTMLPREFNLWSSCRDDPERTDVALHNTKKYYPGNRRTAITDAFANLFEVKYLYVVVTFKPFFVSSTTDADVFGASCT